MLYKENILIESKPLALGVRVEHPQKLIDAIQYNLPELKETEKTLVFKPLFVYGEVQKEWLDFEPIKKAANGKIEIQPRDEPAEQSFLTFMRRGGSTDFPSRPWGRFYLTTSPLQ